MSVKQETLQLTGGAGKDKRRELDYYPTPPACTIALMNFLMLPKMTIWEPCCGDGTMSKVLGRYSPIVISTDIRDTGYGTGGIDFLADTTTHFASAIITNPPFDKSELIIRKALSLKTEVVAMLLKSQYWHAAKRLPLFIKHPPSWILPLTWRPDFLEHERKKGETGSPTMDVAWSVWLKDDQETKYKPLKKPIL